MDAKPTKSPKAMGSLAKPYARATSTIAGAFEPSSSADRTALGRRRGLCPPHGPLR